MVGSSMLLLPDGASIILNASIVASKGWRRIVFYSATKAAVRSFARTWTTDLRDRRIHVNAVSTGSADTPGLSEDSSYITGTELFVDGGFAQV